MMVMCQQVVCANNASGKTLFPKNFSNLNFMQFLKLLFFKKNIFI
jgi:hypothetical protein